MWGIRQCGAKTPDRIFRMSGKIIFEWEIPPDHPNFTGYDSLPEAYRVEENPEAMGGVVIYARYHGEWEANPRCVRTLVRHLLLDKQ